MNICECGCGKTTSRRFAVGHNNRGRALSRRRDRKKGPSGYLMARAAGHPRGNRDGFVLEHILVAEGVLGRYLPEGAQVHHVDCDRANNAKGNLVICQDQGYHSLLHRRLRALESCGNPAALRCMICHGYDRQDDITVTTDARSYHRSCNVAHVKKYPKRKKANAD